VHVLLIESVTTINTGNAGGERTAVPKTTRIGRANAGCTAACACSYDIPPTGMPANVTPSATSTGGAASPLRTGARQATTTTAMTRRLSTALESY